MQKLHTLAHKHKKILKFGTVGTISAIIDLTILTLLVEIFGLPIIIANTISFLFAVVNSFILNKNWTFRCKDPRHFRQFLKFISISTVGLILNILFMWLLLQYGIWYIAAKVLIIGLVGIWNFLANSYWTFNNEK